MSNMNQDQPQVLVTNADSSLGHSVLRNIAFSYLRKEIKLLALASSKEAFGGHHYCDEVLLHDDGGSVERLEQLCLPRSVRLILPTSERETVELKENQDRLPFFPPEIILTHLSLHTSYAYSYQPKPLEIQLPKYPQSSPYTKLTPNHGMCLQI